MLDLVYERNKELDEIFFTKYGKEEQFQNNCIELLVELGEFINETKCFKYWSVKKPNKELLDEEYADVITMILYFCNILDMDVKDFKMTDKNISIQELINDTYNLCTKLMKNLNKDLISKILDNVLTLGYKFSITEEEIINAVRKKHEIIYERLNGDY